MNYDELNLFFKKRNSFIISSLLLTVLFLSGLAVQSIIYQGALQVFVSVFLVLISVLFNLTLGTPGFVMSVILNIVQIVIYAYRFVQSQQVLKLYLISLSILSLIVIVLFQIFFRRIADKMNTLQERFEKEQHRRINSETQALIGDTVRRTSLIVRHEDIKDKKEVAEVIEMSVSKPIDSMTTLPNRDMIIDHLDHLIDNSIKEDQNSTDENIKHNPIYVYYVTVHDAVRFSNRLGHRIVDLSIQAMAHRLRESAHPSDMVGRVSRNEFAVITSRFKNDDEANAYVDVIRNAMAEYETSNFMCGVVQYPRDGRFPGELVHLAESRMRNPDYVKFTPDHEIISVTDQSKSANELKNLSIADLKIVFDKAIENEEIHMVYQPRFDSNKKLTGFEAFVRWNSPDYGIVNTRDFLVQAEKTGHIYQIGKISMESALKKLVELNAIEPTLSMTINLSITEIRNPSIVKYLTDAITESGCNVKNIIIDIPEEGLTSGIHSIRSTLEKLSNMDITMALDNFGRGYSSLNNIPLSPISLLKLDGHFTEDMSDGSAQRILTKSIIELLSDIDIPVAATGVATQEQFATLSEFGCAYFQGRHLCMPLSSRDTIEYACRFFIEN